MNCASPSGQISPTIITNKPQRIPMEPRRVRSLVLKELISADGPSPFPALTQIEAWGVEADGQ